MEKVIGLGATGCSVAEEFSEYPEYRVYKIGSGLPTKGNYVVEARADIQSYEEAADGEDLAIYLRSVREGDDVVLVLGGGEPMTGMALTVLEQLKGSKVSILYISPDRSMCSKTQLRDDRIVHNILQQYARSGLFERIYFIDRSAVEDMVGDVSIKDFERSVSNLIASTVAMVNYFNHTEPVISNSIEPDKICRIATFGVSALKVDADVKYLSALNGAQDIHYYYGIPSSYLEEDGALMRDIKTQTKSLSEPEVNTSFSVYSTTFEEPMVLCVAYTKEIQKF
tara:strand:+ start:5744 stop:6589 length:846 start_codon:yes stop_codon:yes gene_type:complete